MQKKQSGKLQTNLKLENFKNHCARRGYELLKDDYAFIDRVLTKMNRSDFKAVLERYLDEWGLGMAQSESFNKEQGCGRRRANLWLLRYIDDYLAAKAKEQKAC